MGSAAYIGRVGGLALALGVGTAIATGHGIAAAEGSDSSGSSSQSSSSSGSGSASGSSGSSGSSGTSAGSAAGTATAGSAAGDLAGRDAWLAGGVDDDLRISVLSAANARLRAALVDLHAAVELDSSPEARVIEAQIWDELRRSTERRLMSGALA